MGVAVLDVGAVSVGAVLAPDNENEEVEEEGVEEGAG